MNRTAKNIIATLIIFIMLVCSYFTVKYINNKLCFNNIDINNSQRLKFNNKEEFKKQDSNSITNDNESTSESLTNKENDESDTNRNKRIEDSTYRPNKPSKNDFKNFPNNNRKNINNNSFSLYYILFGLESAIIGACIYYLVITNCIKDNKKIKEI